MNVYQIPRNDVAACVAYHDEHGGVTPDEAQTMLMLQDDPTELRLASKSWTMRDRPAPVRGPGE